MVAVTWMERVLYRQICKLLVLTTVSVRFDTALAQGLTLEMSSPALQPMPRRVSRNSRVRPIGPSTAAPAGSKKIVEGWQGWCQKELSSHSSSASSRHHVSFNFWPHLLFNSMHASMDYFSSLAAFLASCRFLRCTFWYLLCLLALIDSG